MARAATKTLIIGSRGSQLALWQANYIANKLAELDVSSRIEIIKTTGDHLQTASLMQAGGKGLFTKEIEEALLTGSIDLAVHSLKDLPTQTPAGLTIAAIPAREDPRDALAGSRLCDLRQGARVGTSSGRRGAQLRAIRPDLRIEAIRGNVDTRLRKLRQGQYDAIMLAAAGLKRLGLEDEIAELLDPERVCPAAGQGALAVETRSNDATAEICRRLNHEESSVSVTCERAALAALGGGCQLPVGAFACPAGGGLSVMAAVVAKDGSRCLRAQLTGSWDSPEDLGRAVAEELLAQGARSILAEHS
ncbi:MAG: hydroxymethylbilane synthase [Acidobacteriaceae bacterium]|nr:hydroxymethylbilane synthase [Acidobacteriaceae bacterium]MBV9499199.1 hydroxymethylbilane synthase [Acidobacteriaceae bacterium]